MRIEVRCELAGDGHRCAVLLLDVASTSHHTVHVSRTELVRWGRGRSAEVLVQDSFRFLLARESKESILPEFDLSVIKRYFAEYDGGP